MFGANKGQYFITIEWQSTEQETPQVNQGIMYVLHAKTITMYALSQFIGGSGGGGGGGGGGRDASSFGSNFFFSFMQFWGKIG